MSVTVYTSACVGTYLKQGFSMLSHFLSPPAYTSSPGPLTDKEIGIHTDLSEGKN